MDLGCPEGDATDEDILFDKGHSYEVTTNDHVIGDFHDTPGKVNARIGEGEHRAWKSFFGALSKSARSLS